MESKFLRAVLWLVMAVVPAISGAQTYSPLTVGDLDAVMQEEIYFKALAERNKAEAALNQAKGGATGTEPKQPAAPQLVWRRATADGWVAKLSFSSGSSALARVGDMLPGGFKTVRVDADNVVISRGGQDFVLGPLSPNSKAAARAPATQPAPLPAPANPVPPPPEGAGLPLPDGRFPMGGLQ